MTLLGKIFTVMILIMSVVFMSFATMVYATHRNWREVVELSPDEATGGQKIGLKFQLDEANEQLAQKEQELADLRTALNREMVARTLAITALQNELITVQDKLAQAQSELTRASEDLASQTQAAQDAAAALRLRQDELITQRALLKETQFDRDTQFDTVVALTDQVNQLKLEVRDLQERGLQLTRQLADAHTVLRLHKLPFVPQPEMAPKLQVKILAVRNDKGLVEIAGGSDDGLQAGHELIAFRGNQYLGKMTIIRTNPDVAVAQIQKGARGVIQRGDDAMTVTMADQIANRSN